MSGKKGDHGSAPNASPSGAAGGSVAPPADVASDAAPKDVLFVRGASEDGRGLQVLRFCDDQVSTGELREVRDGQPIIGELVALKQRGEHERLFDVSVLAKGAGVSKREAPALPGKGPAKVASDAYRTGWENVFGARNRDAKPN